MEQSGSAKSESDDSLSGFVEEIENEFEINAHQEIVDSVIASSEQQEETERNISNENERIEILYVEINDLHTQLLDNTITIDQFASGLSLKKQQIGILRSEMLSDALSKKEISNIQTKLMKIAKKVDAKDINPRKLRTTATNLDVRIEKEMNEVLNEYRGLMEELRRANEPLNLPKSSVSVHATSVSFITDPQYIPNEKEIDLLNKYLYHRFTISSQKDLLSIFKDGNKINDIVKSVANKWLSPDELMSYARQFYLLEINDILLDSEEQEYIDMFKQANKYSSFNKQMIEDDKYKLLESAKVTEREKDRIISKYRDYIPMSGPNPFIMKKRMLKAIRRVPKLDMGMKELRPFASQYETFIKHYMDDTGRLTTDLISILSKFPSKNLFKCARIVREQQEPNYIRRLYSGAKIPILKFRNKPETVEALFKDMEKSVDELHINRTFLKAHLIREGTKFTNTQLVMIDYKTNENSRFLIGGGQNVPIPSQTISEDESNIDKNAIAKFFKSMEDYNAQLIVPTSNTMVDRVRKTYVDTGNTLDDVLSRTRAWQFVTLRGRSLEDFLHETQGKQRISGNRTVTLQKVPIDETVKGSFTVAEDQYRVIVTEPLMEATRAWLLFIQKGNTKVPIVIPTFTKYLEGLMNVMLSNMQNVSGETYKAFKRRILIIRDFLKSKTKIKFPPLAIPPVFSEEKSIRQREMQKLKLNLRAQLFKPMVNERLLFQVFEQLESFCAGVVESVVKERERYIYLMAELRFILRTHPSIPFRMVNHNLLPSEVMNIQNDIDFNSVFLGDQVHGPKIGELLDWKPSNNLLMKFYPKHPVMKLIREETDKAYPDASVITTDLVEEAPPYLKRMIINEAYETIKWDSAVKHAKRMVTKGQKAAGLTKESIQETVYTYLIKERYALPSQKLVTLPYNARMEVVKRIELRVKKCRNFQGVTNWVIATHIETAIFELVGKMDEYKMFIKELENMEIKDFCGLFMEGNKLASDEKLLSNIIHKIVHTGLMAGNKRNFLNNSSLQVLKAFEKLQVIKLDWKGSLDVNTLQKAMKNLKVVKGRIDTEQRETIAASETIQSTGISSVTLNFYYPGKYIQKIPKTHAVSKIALVPLPKRRGFISGGNYPLEAKPYRYISGSDTVKSYLDDVMELFGESVRVGKLDSPSQGPTNSERQALDILREKLKARFVLKAEYEVEELLRICEASGLSYEEARLSGDNDLYLQTCLDRVKALIETVDTPVPKTVKGGKKLLSLKEYKAKMKKENGKVLSDREIVKLYFAQYAKKKVIMKPFIEIYGKVYKVHKHPSIEYPVPFGYLQAPSIELAKVPVYLQNQLEDLAMLLENGYIAPWLVNKVKPTYNKELTKVIGFTGDPPWQIKEENINRIIQRIEKGDIPEGYLSRFYAEKKLTVEKVIQIMQRRKITVKRILRHNLSNKDKKTVIASFRFVDPNVLREEIRRVYAPYFEAYDYIHGPNFTQIMDPSERRKGIAYLKSLFPDFSDPLKSVTRVVNSINNDLATLNPDLPFNQLLEEYIRIANKYNIDSEDVLIQFNAKLRNYVISIDKTVDYLNHLHKSALSDHDMRVELLRVIKLFGISPPGITREKLLAQLRRMGGNVGTLSFYYIEQVFRDRYGKDFIVRNGVSNSKVFYKPDNWNPDTRQIEISQSELLESPEDRANRMLNYYGTIEKVPRRKLATRAVIEPKFLKEDVWSWYPVAKPKDHNELRQWESNPLVKDWKKIVRKELNYLRGIIYNRLRSTSSSFQMAKRVATARLENQRVKIMASMSTKKVKAPRPIKGTTLNNRETFAQETVDNFVRRGVVVVHSAARALIDRFHQRKDVWTRRYMKFSVVYRDNSFVEFRNFRVRLLDIIRNMSFTRKLNLASAKNVRPSEFLEFGELFAYLHSHYRRVERNELNLNQIKDILGKNRVSDWADAEDTIQPPTEDYTSVEEFLPNKPVTIEAQDIMDYLGDSYMQFALYNYGIEHQAFEEGTKTGFLTFPCRYTEHPSTENKFITFGKNGEYQNIYIIDDKLHRADGVTSTVARRLAFLLDIDLRSVPPCFSTTKGQRHLREYRNAITTEDVRDFFISGNKPMTNAKLEIGYDPSRDRTTEKLKQKQEARNKQYRAVLKSYINANPEIMDNRIPGVHMQLIRQLAKEVDRQRTRKLKEIYIESIEIPRILPGAIIDKFVISDSGESEEIKSKIRKKIVQFERKLGVKLDESYLDIKAARDLRPITIKRWKKV